VTRFADYRWLAAGEAARALRRRLPLEAEDVMQVSLLGLHQADRSARADMPDRDFLRFARLRVRGAIIDELRSFTPGSRRGGSTGALRPWYPDPAAMAVAQELGLLPSTGWEEGEVIPRAHTLSPEEQLLVDEAERLQAERINQRLARLPERLAMIVRRRLAGRMAREIAEELGVSPVRVSQLLARALELLAAT
jgi:RNA polymerase sigma factor (sigma-70 family)